MMNSAIIFIGSPEHDSKKNSTEFKNVSQLFLVSPQDIIFRIWASFVPPITQKYCKVYVDLVGPLLGFLLLTAFLEYGYSYKIHKLEVSPVEVMLLFALSIPSVYFLLAKLGKSSISFYETTSLVGYSFYGHLLTLLVSYILFHETSNTFFFISLIIFGGFSSFRLILVFMKTIPIPGARLLVCASISTINILFLIYLHFGYMHKTYKK